MGWMEYLVLSYTLKSAVARGNLRLMFFAYMKEAVDCYEINN